METIKPYKSIKSKWQTVIIGFAVLLFFGVALDLFSGFQILRNSKKIISGIIGLIALAIFYLIGEAGSTWIGEHDKQSDPLHKRAFRLFLLLAYCGIAMIVIWIFYKYSGFMKI